MGRRKIPTATPLPKALACGMLEDNGRVFFLCRTGRNGIEKIELPCVLVRSGRSPFADIKEAFGRLTGISDYEVKDIVLEARHNAGSRKRKIWVPVLVFEIRARNRKAKPAEEFSGFRWLSLDDAKKRRRGRNLEWFLKAKKPMQDGT